MIELRWLEKRRTFGETGFTYVSILQYRFKVHPDVSTTGFTEWQDVPKEIEYVSEPQAGRE